jgi:hypothetical protein
MEKVYNFWNTRFCSFHFFLLCHVLIGVDIGTWKMPFSPLSRYKFPPLGRKYQHLPSRRWTLEVYSSRIFWRGKRPSSYNERVSLPRFIALISERCEGGCAQMVVMAVVLGQRPPPQPHNHTALLHPSLYFTRRKASRAKRCSPEENSDNARFRLGADFSYPTACWYVREPAD